MKTRRLTGFLLNQTRWAANILAGAALLLGCGACASEVAPGTPVPQVFEAPPALISTFTPLSIDSAAAPAQVHGTDFFGAAVAIDGEVLVSGAPGWGSQPGQAFGAAYIFRRSSAGTWHPEAALTASDRNDDFQFDQNFGAAVALGGTVAAVGAPGYDDFNAGDNVGAVYIYEYDGRSWSQTAKLIPKNLKPGAKMGTGLAFDGDLLAVSGSPAAGKVCFYRRTGRSWSELSPLPVPAPDGGAYDVSIDLYGDTLALGLTATRPTPVTADDQVFIQSMRRSGIVFLYQRVGEGWEKVFQTPPQEASLYPMDGRAAGLPVALGGAAGRAALLAIGKPGVPGSGRETGSVVTYERGNSGWKALAELSLAPQTPDPEGALLVFRYPGPAFFGAGIDLEGSRLAVISTFSNAVDVFERQGAGWAYRFRLTPGAGYKDDFQRRTLALSGNELLLGSPGELGSGDVFLFDLKTPAP